jgi:hypothetical protein
MVGLLLISLAVIISGCARQSEPAPATPLPATAIPTVTHYAPEQSTITPSAVTRISTPTRVIPMTTPVQNKNGLTIEENEIIGQVSLEPLTFQPVHGSQQDINARHAPDKGKPYSFQDGLAQNGMYGINPVTGERHFKAFEDSDSGKIVLKQDEVMILQIDAGDGSPISPLRGLWVDDEHWILEIAFVKNIIDGNSVYSNAVGQIYQDGGLLNKQYGYEEMFGFQFLDGKPFYFYKRDGQIHLSYNNEDLPVVYDEIVHYRCCSGAALNPTAGINWIGFWGQRDGIWYYSEIGRY